MEASSSATTAQEQSHPQDCECEVCEIDRDGVEFTAKADEFVSNLVEQRITSLVRKYVEEIAGLRAELARANARAAGLADEVSANSRRGLLAPHLTTCECPICSLRRSYVGLQQQVQDFMQDNVPEKMATMTVQHEIEMQSVREEARCATTVGHGTDNSGQLERQRSFHEEELGRALRGPPNSQSSHHAAQSQPEPEATMNEAGSEVKRSNTDTLAVEIRAEGLSGQTDQAARNCFFDISIDGTHIGRVVFKLHDDIVPKTARNFRELCTGQHGFGYADSTFHRIIPNFIVQGGDFTRHNGTGGKSIYGRKFADENFTFKHSKPGLLSMANSGLNSNGSQFFITAAVTPSFDGRNVVFGEVISGMDVVKAIGAVERSLNGTPEKTVKITASGVV